MKEIFRINLAPSDITRFINKANTIPNDINLFQDNNIVVSGKSIMGVCSLDFNKEIYMIVRDRLGDEIVYQIFGDWICDKLKGKKNEV